MSLTRTVLVPTAAGELAVRAVRPGPEGWGLEIVAGDADALSTSRGRPRGRGVGEIRVRARPARRAMCEVADADRRASDCRSSAPFATSTPGDYSIVVALDWYRTRWNDESFDGHRAYTSMTVRRRRQSKRDSRAAAGHSADPIDGRHPASLSLDDLRSDVPDHRGVAIPRGDGCVSRRAERAALDRARARS